ncbi:MAG: dihydrofolate reductase family protein [Halobacteriota archaeon]
MSAGTVTLYIATSLDGFVATGDGGVSWLEPFEEEASDRATATSYEEFFAGVDCLVMGSKTYEQVLGFGDWPYGETPTYVVTHRDLPRVDDAVTFYDGDLRELAGRLRRQYAHSWLVGGAELAQAFLRFDLVDDIRLSIAPVLLGSGIAFFDDAGTTHDLTLRDTTTFQNGIVELWYDVGDAV